ncbi:hypothetical protein CVT25_013485 [Psilocybe cyanescens]|uniref:Uncharacterized protein n=1 Tax=Psilocybe cyanescens TaxID=93625 RepID=A0A409WTS6_PSICY|nr:hypothetical protein CVT25_013485 [Psilocybe cyanescens]
MHHLHPRGPKERACKVDILLLGVLDIPHIPRQALYRDPSAFFLSFSFSSPPSSFPSASSSTSSSPLVSNPIPTGTPMPIPSIAPRALLTLKLRAWADHAHPTAPDPMHARVPAGVYQEMAADEERVGRRRVRF